MSVINVTCVECDYKEQCSRTFVYNDIRYVAKEQNFLRMKCLNQVEDICKDCRLFKEKRCASWKTLNGKDEEKPKLEICPKKETIVGGE